MSAGLDLRGRVKFGSPRLKRYAPVRRFCIVYFAICDVHAFHIRFGCREPWFRGTVRISARRRKAYLYAGHTHIETMGLSDCFYYCALFAP